MIALEFTGVLSDNAHTTEENGKMVLTFPVTVTRHMKQDDGAKRVLHTKIICRKTGAFAVDARFRKGAHVYMRGDITAATDSEGNPQFHSNVWQFELL